MAPSTLSITLWLHLCISEFTCNMLRFFYIIQKVYLRTYRVETSERAKKKKNCESMRYRIFKSTVDNFVKSKTPFQRIINVNFNLRFTIGKHWIEPSTIAFRKRDENGSHTAIRHPYTASIASALHSPRCSKCITIYVRPRITSPLHFHT